MHVAVFIHQFAIWISLLQMSEEFYAPGYAGVSRIVLFFLNVLVLY